jgi:hypothetical protein
MPLEVVFRAPRRDLTLGKRDRYGLKSLDVNNVKEGVDVFAQLLALLVNYRNAGAPRRLLAAVFMGTIFVYCRVLDILTIVEDTEEVARLRKRVRIRQKTFADFAYLEFSNRSFSEKFRFRDVDQLERLKRGFHFPDTVSIRGYPFRTEEIILFSLVRLAYPLRWGDVQDTFPGRERWELGYGFYWFLDYMIQNWAYLVLNNRAYWKPYLPVAAEKVRQKLATLPNIDNRIFLRRADGSEGGGCRIALFLDNTLNATCRPGGGPMSGGELAPRYDVEEQRAFWTGWKKIHGFKWQTVDMPNGMNFEIAGPFSVRRNDNFTKDRSKIEDKLEQLQEGDELKYIMHGDSAYGISDFLISGGGRGMAAVREIIEWDYGDLKGLWKCMDYKTVLKMKGQPVGKIVLVALILRNAHSAMNGSQTSQYFRMSAPPFEDWVSQGPRAHPIPEDSCFREGADGHDDDE